MKRNVLFGAIVMLAGTVLAADSPKDDVVSAAKALADKANYSWKTTVAVTEGSRFRPGPTEGKTEKDGVTHLKTTFGENTSDSYIKGDKAAASGPDGWQSLADMENAEGPGRFFAGMLKGFKAPAAQAQELANGAKELKKDGDAIAGELTEEAAKPLLTFRRGGGASVSGAKGSVKFWTKDGVLSKMEYKVSGKVTFDGNDRDVERTTTTEIKDIGTTKVEVPDEAKKKLS